MIIVYGKKIVASIHIHSHFSDGEYSPKELFQKADMNGLSIVITDHDNMAASHEAQVCCQEFGMVYIPGVEISAEWKGKNWDILSYGHSITPKLMDIFQRNLHSRKQQAILTLHEFINRGLIKDNISFDQLMSSASPNSVMYDEVFIKRYLAYKFGILITEAALTLPELYSTKLLGIPTRVSIYEVIDAINEAGGKAFLAHPAKNFFQLTRRFGDVNIIEKYISDLVEHGLIGIEAGSPNHYPYEELYLRNLAEKFRLQTIDGADYHGDTIPLPTQRPIDMFGLDQNEWKIFRKLIEP